MSAHAAAADRRAPAAARPRLALEPAHFGVAAVLAVAWGGANALGFWLGHETRDLGTLVIHFVVEALLPLCLLAVGLAAADAAIGEGEFRVAPYAIAAIGAAVLGEAVFRLGAPLVGLADCGCNMDRWPLGARVANMLPDSVVICACITAGWCYRRRALARTARVHAAELEDARLLREMQESRLQAMQACIEPQFLFDTLGEVDRLKHADAPRAARLLDDLIAYLRAALPNIGATASTVAKECGLATAYLNIHRLRDPSCPAFEIALPDGAGDARLPPMLLLPLIECAVGELRGGALRIRLETVADRLRITLAATGALATDVDCHESAAAVRERLRSVYGSAASLDAQTAADGTLLTMEIPHERTDGRAR